jgi:hypothetical protein
MPDHDIHVEESHGEVSSLYRSVCDCGWIGSDAKSADDPVEEGWRHLEGRPMPWQEANDWSIAPPQNPPLPGWPTSG